MRDQMTNLDCVKSDSWRLYQEWQRPVKAYRVTEALGEIFEEALHPVIKHRVMYRLLSNMTRSLGSLPLNNTMHSSTHHGMMRSGRNRLAHLGGAGLLGTATFPADSLLKNEKVSQIITQYSEMAQ